jgi:hypothetical protein
MAVGQDTSSGPCAIQYKDKLYLFFRDGAGNGMLHYQSEDGYHWHFPSEANWYLDINIDLRPSAAVLGDTFCVVGKDHNGTGIMFATFDGKQWHPGFSGLTTSGAPTVVAHRDRFHVYFIDGSGNGILHGISDNGTQWARADLTGIPLYVGVESSAGPAAVEVGDSIRMFYRDPRGNGVFWAKSDDGNYFPPINESYFGLDVRGEPSAAIFDERLHVIGQDAEGGGIMHSKLQFS